MDQSTPHTPRKRNEFFAAFLILGLGIAFIIPWLWNAAFANTMGLDVLLWLAGLLFGFVLLLVVLILGKVRRWTRRGYLAATLACVLWMGWGFVGLRVYWMARYWGFERASHRADLLIEAIEHYQQEHGKPPEKLAELLPHYIKAIPATGLPAYPAFKYERLSGRQTLAFWDLGSRHGEPMSGLWVYPDGDADHAIMAATLDERSKVLDARVDRMPKRVAEVRFDKAKWGSGINRMEMVRSFAKSYPLKGRSLGELTSLLGTPTGKRSLVDSDWELRIECSNGPLNWDVFYFWPTQRYPEHSHGGYVVKVGKWAYVHE